MKVYTKYAARRQDVGTSIKKPSAINEAFRLNGLYIGSVDEEKKVAVGEGFHLEKPQKLHLVALDCCRKR